MLVGILIMICSIVVWVLYHKLFDVIYFNVASGCLKEILICFFIGALLAYGIITFWYITVPIAIIVCVIIYKRNH